MDAIWCALHPSSARRRAIAFRRPCALRPLGRPASSQRFLNQLPKLAADLKGQPELVARKVVADVRLTTFAVGIALSASQKSGSNGMTSVVCSRPLVLDCAKVITSSKTFFGPRLMTSPRRAAVGRRSSKASRAIVPSGCWCRYRPISSSDQVRYPTLSIFWRVTPSVGSSGTRSSARTLHAACSKNCVAQKACRSLGLQGAAHGPLLALPHADCD